MFTYQARVVASLIKIMIGPEGTRLRRWAGEKLSGNAFLADSVENPCHSKQQHDTGRSILRVKNQCRHPRCCVSAGGGQDGAEAGCADADATLSRSPVSGFSAEEVTGL